MVAVSVFGMIRETENLGVEPLMVLASQTFA
jgi:hypothetical protein